MMAEDARCKMQDAKVKSKEGSDPRTTDSIQNNLN